MFIRNISTLLCKKSTYALLGAFLIHLTLGNKYTLSNVNTYMTSYMRKHGTPRATYGNSIWFSTCYSIGQPTSMVIGGFLERKFSARLTCLLGCALYSISIALTSQSIDHGFLMALLTYGLIPGLGCGLAYMTPMSNGFGWFPEKRGIVAGGILAGLGLGPFIFNMVQTKFVNPFNLSPESHMNGYFTQDSILQRVPGMFILLGCSYGLLELIGCSILFEPPKLENNSNGSIRKNSDVSSIENKTVSGQVDSNDNQCRSHDIDIEALQHQSLEGKDIFPDPKIAPSITTATLATSDAQIENVQSNTNNGNQDVERLADDNEELVIKEAIKTREFIVLFIAFGLTTQGMLFVNSQLKRYGQLYIMDDNFLAWSGSLGSLANCFGRVFWGLAVDRFSFTSCLATSAFMFCLGSLLTPFQFILSSKILFLLMTILLFVSISGWVCMFPVHISRVFGRTNGSIMYGLVYLSQPAISILISPLIQYLIDHTNRYIPFYCVLATNFTGLLIYLILYPGCLFISNKKKERKIIKSQDKTIELNQ